MLQEGNKRSIRIESVVAHRGIIFDRNGSPLAVSTQVPSIWAVPEELISAKAKWHDLADLLKIPIEKLEEKIINSGNKDFIYLKRHITPDLAKKILQLNIAGVHTLYEPKRYYPSSEVTAHLIGITDIDEQGQEGIELAFNHVLTGRPGKRKLHKDCKGAVIRQVETLKAVYPGNELTLSIDLRIQFLAHQALDDGLRSTAAKSGSVIVVDISTGEILALVNSPTYNPNNRSVIDHKALRNRAVTDAIEPGSTLKPFVMVAALESKLYNSESKINTAPGYITLGDHQIKDYINFNQLSLQDILVKSSNVGVSKIAFKIGYLPIKSLFQRLKFGFPSGIGFPGEYPGFLPDKDNLSKLELATLSFGYGILVTPLQLAHAYMILGSGIDRPLSIFKQNQLIEGKRVIASEIIAQLHPMLQAVVERGSGKLAKSDYIKLGGKTGTIRKVLNTGYAKNSHSAIFAGLAPINKPRLAIVVVIDETDQKKYYASSVAAPIFLKVAEGATRVLNILFR